MEQQQAMAAIRAEQARRLEAELVGLVQKHGFILKMNKPVCDALRNVAEFNNFSQLQGVLK